MAAAKKKTKKKVARKAPAKKKRARKKRPAARKPKGRPTRYTKTLGNCIALRIAQGESVRNIAKDDKMPAASSIFKWALDPEHDFSEQYDRAKRIRAETLVDEIVDIADDSAEDYVEISTGKGKRKRLITRKEHVQRSRLRVDTRKWFAGKVAPKLYGDKLAHTGEDGEGPVNIIVNESGKSDRAD